ncbi:histamine N-methyltransferase-like isoform X2 [Brachyhypopomus gauderio]|uniref:histamine N-methyltransferase-like isoform X2 n=1 Tax=Brachyhypopomus gauderio TaxID=698409 RepID=UPI0040435496
MDFIHMIQALYYVDDPEAAILFFQRLLQKNGKLLLILVSDVWMNCSEKSSGALTQIMIQSMSEVKDFTSALATWKDTTTSHGWRVWADDDA